MKRAATACLLACLFQGAWDSSTLFAQEAQSGFDLRSTLSGQGAISNELTEPPRNGAPGAAGFRGVVYPTWKFNENWTATAALQLVTRPYFYDSFSDAGFGAKGYVLQASLNYARVSKHGSLLVRVGQLSTSFGSYLLRYDDADNPLVDLPPEYGYYYAAVSTLGLAGGQIDVARSKWDARVQFANSSPANPRSLFQHDQYGNWSGGAGYTIRQGFRVGVSAYRGPYLYRQYPYFFPGEANPSKLIAHAVGVDATWARNHTSLVVEGQRFVMPYKVIPTRLEVAAYFEAKQTLSPRWYLALRTGLTSATLSGMERNLEADAAYRPNRFQLLKFDYEIEHYDTATPHNSNTFAVQLVTTLHLSAARR
jgi:hypothetical protein